MELNSLVAPRCCLCLQGRQGREGWGGREQGWQGGGEGCLGREAGEEAWVQVSSVPISGPTHRPHQSQGTGTVSSTSSSTTSSADEEFHPQLSRSKVTTLGKPTGPWLVGPFYHPDFRPNVGSSCSSFIRKTAVSLHLTATTFYLEQFLRIIFIYITFRSLPFKKCQNGKEKKTDVFTWNHLVTAALKVGLICDPSQTIAKITASRCIFPWGKHSFI